MIQKIAVGLLVVWVCWMGYLAHHAKYDQNKNLFAPNLAHRIALPPPILDEAVRQEEAIAKAAKVDLPLHINGKEVILMPVREPSRQEWMRIDDKTRSDAQMRKLYKVHG